LVFLLYNRDLRLKGSKNEKARVTATCVVNVSLGAFMPLLPHIYIQTHKTLQSCISTSKNSSVGSNGIATKLETKLKAHLDMSYASM